MTCKQDVLTVYRNAIPTLVPDQHSAIHIAIHCKKQKCVVHTKKWCAASGTVSTTFFSVLCTLFFFFFSRVLYTPL